MTDDYIEKKFKELKLTRAEHIYFRNKVNEYNAIAFDEEWRVDKDKVRELAKELYKTIAHHHNMNMKDPANAIMGDSEDQKYPFAYYTIDENPDVLFFESYSEMRHYAMYEMGMSSERWEFSFLPGRMNVAFSAYADTYKDYQQGVSDDVRLDKNKHAMIVFEMMQNTGYFAAFSNVLLVCENPICKYEVLNPRDDQGQSYLERINNSYRLHCTTGPAIGWPRSKNPKDVKYFIRGVEIPNEMFENFDNMTAKEVFSIDNVEIRRVLIDLYAERRGDGQLMIDLGAKMHQKDDFGELYKIDLPDDPDEVMVMVKVVNSTPESDGSFKDYWMRVPPNTRTARQGVAWLGHIENPEDYAPEVET